MEICVCESLPWPLSDCGLACMCVCARFHTAVCVIMCSDLLAGG